MSNWEGYYKDDTYRYGGVKLGGAILNYQKCLRKAHFCNNRFLLLFYRWKLRNYRKHYGLEIPYTTEIGGGLYLGHPFNITINPHAVLGNNCNLHKGVLIGAENRGKRMGAPKIGNKVWIGINSAIVGNVVIGDDVLIAPCSFVNCDVPSHSIVYGNPCVIKHRENATEGYINNVT